MAAEQLAAAGAERLAAADAERLAAAGAEQLAADMVASDDASVHGSAFSDVVPTTAPHGAGAAARTAPRFGE